MEKIIWCITDDLVVQCGTDTLKFAINMHTKWIRSYNSKCNISLPSTIKTTIEKINDELSMDGVPTVIENDGTIPPSQMHAVSLFPKIQSESAGKPNHEPVLNSDSLPSDHMKSINLTTVSHLTANGPFLPTSGPDIEPTRLLGAFPEPHLETPDAKHTPEPLPENDLTVTNPQPEPEPEPGSLPPTGAGIPITEPDVLPNTTKQRTKGYLITVYVIS